MIFNIQQHSTQAQTERWSWPLPYKCRDVSTSLAPRGDMGFKMMIRQTVWEVLVSLSPRLSTEDWLRDSPSQQRLTKVALRRAGPFAVDENQFEKLS